MNISSINKVWLRGFVGRYIKMPVRPSDPARFDLVTIEKVTIDTGEVHTNKHWLTIKTWDQSFVQHNVHTGDLVEVVGSITSRLINNQRSIEIKASSIEVMVSQADRDLLRAKAHISANDEY